MSWQEFEVLVGEGLKRRGYGVRETGGGGADAGVDVVLTKSNERFFVHASSGRRSRCVCPRCASLPGHSGGGRSRLFVVTSGQFTADPHAFAVGRNFHSLDGQALTQLLRDGHGQQAAKSRAAEPGSSKKSDTETQPTPATIPKQPSSVTKSGLEPKCPRCSKPMIRRVAKIGATMGRNFWDAIRIRLGVVGREI
jgi:restriction system protein